MTWSTVIVLMAAGGNFNRFDPLVGCFLLLALYFIVRSLFLGVFVSEQQLTVVSWFRTYRIPKESIRAVNETYYDGFMTRWSSSEGAAFSSRVRMIGIWMSANHEKNFQVTITSRGGSQRIAEELADGLGVQIYRAPTEL